MKKRRMLWVCILCVFLIQMNVLAAVPVVTIGTIQRESDGTVTVELIPEEKYHITDLRIAYGNVGKEQFEEADKIEQNIVRGLKTGTYTLFAMDEEGNIGAYPLRVGEEERLSQTEDSSSDAWEKEESREYGSSWLEYQVIEKEIDPKETTDTPEEEENRDPGPEPEEKPTKKPEKPEVIEETSSVVKETDPKETQTTTEAVKEPVEELPQTGGLDGRMLAALMVCICGIVGGVLFFRSSH